MEAAVYLKEIVMASDASSLREAKRRSNPALDRRLWIASLRSQ
jgi:hypothetical protein